MAAARVRPPRPSNWGAMPKLQKKNWHHEEHLTRHPTFGPHGTPAAAGAAGAAEDWQMGNAGTVAAAVVAVGEAEDGLGGMVEAGAEKASGVTTATDRIPMPAPEVAAAGGRSGVPGAPPATMQEPVAEALYEGAECDVEMGNTAEAPVAAAAAGVRPPRPNNWDTITRMQRKMWKKQGGQPRHCPGPK